jgi:hypothetical protein
MPEASFNNAFMTALVHKRLTLWTPLNDKQCSVRSIYSMMPMGKIISFLYEIDTSKNGMGSRLERERERERERNGLREYEVDCR